MRTPMSTRIAERSNNLEQSDDEIFSDLDYEFLPDLDAHTPDTPSSGEDDLEALQILSVSETPPAEDSAQHVRGRTSLLEAEVLQLRLQLATTKLEKNRAVAELKEVEADLDHARIDSSIFKKDLVSTENQLNIANTQLHELKRVSKKKEPLFQIGVAVRLGFMDVANRVRIKGNTGIVSQDLYADNGILQARTDACHRGNLLADASLFDPELEIPGATNHVCTFNHLYSSEQVRNSMPPRYSRSSSFDASRITSSLDNVDPHSLNMQPELCNANDLRHLQANKDTVVARPKLLEIQNLKASMTAYHSWTRYSNNKKADERFNKLEMKARALADRLEICKKTDDDVTDENKQRNEDLFEEILGRMGSILKETVKREHSRLQGRRGR